MLGLSHHRQTARRLPHHHTHYAALVFAVLVGGVVLAGVTANTLAGPPPPGSPSANIRLTAAVYAQPPTIITPTSGQVFKNIPVTVSGSCMPGFGVNLYKNAVLAGSVACDASGQFSLKIDLFAGRNELIARSYDSTGPVSSNSNSVIAFYDQPLPPASTVGRPNSPLPALEQFLIKSDTGYQGVETSSELTWTAEFSGGQPPYAISWDWGDGSVEVINQPAAGRYTGKHSYSKAGRYRIAVQGKDSAGSAAWLQLAVIVRQAGPVAAPTNDSGWLAILWPLYIMLLLVVVSFWLGERYQKERQSDQLPVLLSGS